MEQSNYEQPTSANAGARSSLPGIHDFKSWHGESARWNSRWHPEAERLEGFVHAYQWTDEEKHELEERRGQKAIRSPHIAKVIWSMVGWRAQNKYEIKYLPRGGSDLSIAEARTSLAKFIWDQNRAEYAVGDACMQQYIGPLGWVKVDLQYDDPTAEPIRIEAVSWREMGWDFRAKKQDLTDAKYVWRERWRTLEDAKFLYPEKADELEKWAQARSEDQREGITRLTENADGTQAPAGSWSDENYFFGDRREVRIVEVWYRHHRHGHYLELPDGRTVEFDPKNQDHQLMRLLGAKTYPAVLTDLYTATFCGSVELEHLKSPYDHGFFPYVPFWGLVDQKGIPYGITRLIEDEQVVANWMTSKLIWAAASERAFIGPGADEEEVAENLAKPNGLIRRTRPDDVEIIPKGEMTATAQALLTNAINNLREISGNTDEMRGQESNAKSGRAILARQSAALRQQGRFLDNEQRALTQIGQMLASLMDLAYTTEKILRITEANGKPAQVAVNVGDPLRRDQLEQAGIKVYGTITQGQYDTIVTTAPLSTSEREAMSEQMTALMAQLDPTVRLALLDLWVDTLDPPNKDEIIARIQQVQQMALGGGQPDPAAVEAQQRMASAEIASKEADAMKKHAEAASIQQANEARALMAGGVLPPM